MKIRYLSIRCEYDLIDELFAIKFNSSVNFICDYLSKASRKSSLESDLDYNMISVSLSSSNNSCSIIPENALSIRIHVTSNELLEYFEIERPDDRYELVLDLLQRGYRYASSFYSIPYEGLMCIHNMFREINFKNEWIEKKLFLRKYDMSIVFTSCFTETDFHLKMLLSHKKTQEFIQAKTVFSVPPHWACFEKEIRRISLDGDIIYVDDFLGRHNCMISIKNDCQDKATVVYSDTFKDWLYLCKTT